MKAGKTSIRARRRPRGTRWRLKSEGAFGFRQRTDWTLTDPWRASGTRNAGWSCCGKKVMRVDLARFAIASMVVCSMAAVLRAQDEPNPHTLIPQRTLEAIADEVSGTLAFQHIVELAGYEHDRLPEEYKTTYREAAYIEKMARQYGLEDVHIERFKLPNKTWDGEVGELWMESPEKRLIISYRDVAATLATGSKPADVTTELVYVG